jgi:hypothetical protein
LRWLVGMTASAVPFRFSSSFPTPLVARAMHLVRGTRRPFFSCAKFSASRACYWGPECWPASWKLRVI